MALPRSLQISLVVGICCAVWTSALFAAPTAHTFETGGVKIRYYVEGQGEPVVLIHGLHSSASVNWMAVGVFAELAKDHQVIALDLPGHGQSDKPNDGKAYGVQLVKDIVVLLDHLQIKQAHFVGYSLGGMIAVKLLVMYPERALSGTIGGMGWLREGSPLQRVWEQMPGRKGMRTPQVVTHTMGQFARNRKRAEGDHGAGRSHRRRSRPCA